MQQFTIYHNPRCSKSRETLKLLETTGSKPIVVEYLKNPLTYEQLISLRSHFLLADFVRTHETIFKVLGLSLNDEQNILHAMTQHPILMQRPIVTYKDKAAIGRPPEKILDLFH
jgi:arsenate reductase (glutaredoxin)